MLTGRVGLSPIMIGRGAILDRLRGVVELAGVHASDLPTVGLIAGEAGIGKTRLLREVIAAAPDPLLVLSAIAEPRSVGRSFDVAGQLAPAGSADPGADAMAAVADALRAGPVALVIEDLHWIDAESVAVIDAIARQPWPNLVIVATYRPSDLTRGAPGGDLVLRLERRNEVEQFRLDRLDRNEVGALMAAIVGQPVSSASVEAVFRRSNGVPFVIEELMRVAGPEACSDDIAAAQLPWSLEEAVRNQLDDLDQHDRRIVEAMAVFGQPAGFEVLSDLTGFDERELLVHLRELVARGVIAETREDRLWFGHALVAESVMHQLLGRERRRLHEASFATLSRVAPDDYAALAHHADGAGRFDAIVEIAAVGAPAYLDRGATFQSLRLATLGLAEEPDSAALLAVATEAAWRLDFLAEAMTHAAAWLRVAPSMAQRIDAMRMIGRMHGELHQTDEATGMIDELIALADSLPFGADRGRAEAAVAQLLMLRNDDRAAPWAERAIETAQVAGDMAVLVQARIEWASAQSHRADRNSSIVALRDAAEQARAIGDGVLLARALNNTLELYAPHSEESRSLRSQLRAIALAHGLDKLGRLNVLWWDAMSASAAGDLASTRRRLEEWAMWTVAPMNSLQYRAELAKLAAEEGRVVDGLALLDDGVVGGGCLFVDISVQRLHLAAVARDTAAGATAFTQLIASDPLGDSWYAASDVASIVASALDVGIAPAVVRHELFDVYLATHPGRDQLLDVAAGLLALAEGRHDEAVRALRVTAVAATTMMPVAHEASIRLSLAQALLARNDRVGALDEARRSSELLARWPGWRRDRAEAMVARLEGSAVRAVGDLTARESEVAALIADGLTNGQLAERLFISPKTAAVHVSNILAKLGLSSRTEIAAWSIRRELPVAG